VFNNVNKVFKKPITFICSSERIAQILPWQFGLKHNNNANKKTWENNQAKTKNITRVNTNKIKFCLLKMFPLFERKKICTDFMVSNCSVCTCKFMEGQHLPFQRQECKKGATEPAPERHAGLGWALHASGPVPQHLQHPWASWGRLGFFFLSH